jgi:formylglycine-generating enzyme required for sulfatase activity
MPPVSRDVFISHASADATLALRVCDGLEKRGVRCWIAPRDVRSDGTYGSEILKGLRECEVFLILVTDASAASEQVEREAERASHYNKRIIPVTIGQTEAGPRLEYYIAGRQRVHYPAAPDEGAIDRLIAVIRGTVVADSRPSAPSPVQRKWLLAGAASAVAVLGVGYFIVTSDFSTAPPLMPLTNTSATRPEERPATNATAESVVKSPTPIAPPPTAPPPVNTTPARAATETVAKGRPSNTAPAASPGSGGSSAATFNGVRVTFATIPAGTFRMGCSDGDNDCEDDEKPVRNVTVDPFQMSTTEVTQELWQAVMGANPSNFSGSTSPVEYVSWQDAKMFVDKLNQKADGFSYRLPTEAEWEYAARADQRAAPELPAVAWFSLFGGSNPRPQRVATKKPNKWGLYDMLGNVAEWCEDWYSPNHQRVIRGGSWVDSAKTLRPSARGKAVPTTKDYSIGVRLVRTRR